MEYKGKLYGHLGGKMYFDTGKTADDWDALEKRVADLEVENQALRQPPVSRRFFVCEDINYLNEIKVISTEFDKWEDADSFRKTMKEGLLYKHKSLLIINVC